jgi:hypothetical protein
MDDFETFTRDKISRLRAEADALEKILKEFQGTKARKDGVARRSGGDQPRGGAFGVIMDAILQAGREGMTLDEMIAVASEDGYEVKRPTLRAQCWKAKEDGVLTAMEPGRYRSSTIDDFAGVRINPQDLTQQPEHGFGADRRSVQPAIPDNLDDEIPF